MSEIRLIERDMTKAEFELEKKGFRENVLASGNPLEDSQRFGFVALDGEKFIGCSSALAYKTEHGFSSWSYLTDLFVDKDYRKRGIGAELLQKLEKKLYQIGTRYIYTWTADFEAPCFYQKHGYQIFAEMEDWYYNGESRIGLRKDL